MYLSIAIKLLVGMLGVIFFLRISGKTQMAQLTPLDSVNSFVLGALVGGVIYNPDTPVWYLVFAFAVWTAANVSLRYLMRFHRIRRAIKGDSVMLVRDRRLVMREFRRNGLEMEQFRTMLRENGIFSMFDVDDVRFETNGRITISRRNEPPESYLLVNGGKVMEDALERSGKGKRPEGYVEPPLEELAKLRKPEEPEEVPDLKGAASPLAAALEAVFNGETPQYEGVGTERSSEGNGRSRDRRRSSRNRRSGGRPQEGERPAREGGRPKEEQQSHRSEQRKPRPERQPKGGESREKAGGKPAQEPGEKRSRPRRRRPRGGGGGKPQGGSAGQE